MPSKVQNSNSAQTQVAAKSVHEKCWMGMCLNLAEDFLLNF